jgi:hypothetical protein
LRFSYKGTSVVIGYVTKITTIKQKIIFYLIEENQIPEFVLWPKQKWNGFYVPFIGV